MPATALKPGSLLAQAPEAAIALALHRRRRQARQVRAHDPWRTEWARPEQLPPPGDWWTTWLILAGRGFGKTRAGAEFTREELAGGMVELGALVGRTAADVRDVMIEGEALALDTPIPTGDGWTTMGELRAGDTVFDEQGQPCTVLWVTDVMQERPCYRVVFSDGSVIVADANHKWLTHSQRARHAARRSARPEDVPAVVTTAEMAATLIHRSGNRNHAVAVCAPLVCPPAALPIDPYLLGLWLGDGTAKHGAITTADPEIVRAFRDGGYRVSNRVSCNGQAATYGVLGLQEQLRALGLLRNKHVPARYLRASAEQRLALLQGLMDTDGYVSQPGQCAFDNPNLALVDAVAELAGSLGIKVGRIQARQDKRWRHAKPGYRVTFLGTQPIFRLPRKAARIADARDTRSGYRFVVAVEPVESVPVKCIAVDSPSHLFLAGRAFIPTHNSGLVRCCERYGIKVRYEPSKRRVTFPNGARLICYSAEDPDQLRGPNIGFAWADEVAAWDDPDAWDQLQMTLRAVHPDHPARQPRQVATTTPRPRPHVKEIVADPSTVVTKGKTSDNAANLARVFLEKITRRYQGTRLGRQELEGELLDDVEGALWTHATIEAARVGVAPHLKRVVVAIDPTVGGAKTEDGDYAGVVGAGIDHKGEVYVLAVPCQVDERGAELPGLRGMPADWATAGIRLYDELRADRLVAEKNQGGEMVRGTILAALQGPRFRERPGPAPAITLVHAKRGKALRAEPVSALYEQGKVHHVGLFRALEDQMSGFPVTEGAHDDLVDALVYAVLELTGGPDRTIQSWR